MNCDWLCGARRAHRLTGENQRGGCEGDRGGEDELVGSDVQGAPLRARDSIIVVGRVAVRCAGGADRGSSSGVDGRAGRVEVVVAGVVTGVVDEVRVGAHRAGGREAVLQGNVDRSILKCEVVRVEVVCPRRSFLHDSTVRSGVVEDDVVGNRREVVGHGRPAPRAHDDPTREVSKNSVVRNDFVGCAVPELNAPAGVAERNVIPNDDPVAGAVGVSDVNALNIGASARRAVVVDEVVDHPAVRAVDDDGAATGRAAAVRGLGPVDVVAEDLRRVPGRVNSVAATRWRT